jgi:hypothetical protein
MGHLRRPAYMAAVFKYPNRNIALRQGAQIIQRHDGEPKPEPPIKARDPNLRSWSAHLIAGKKMQFLGNLEVATEPAAIETAGAPFSRARNSPTLIRLVHRPLQGATSLGAEFPGVDRVIGVRVRRLEALLDDGEILVLRQVPSWSGSATASSLALM